MEAEFYKARGTGTEGTMKGGDNNGIPSMISRKQQALAEAPGNANDDAAILSGMKESLFSGAFAARTCTDGGEVPVTVSIRTPKLLPTVNYRMRMEYIDIREDPVMKAIAGKPLDACHSPAAISVYANMLGKIVQCNDEKEPGEAMKPVSMDCPVTSNSLSGYGFGRDCMWVREGENCRPLILVEF